MTGKILKAMFSLMICLSATIVRATTADADPQVLVLKFADATTAEFLFADTPEITFGDGKLVVTCTNGTTEYDESNVAEYYFIDTPTAIGQTTIGHLTFRYTDNSHVYVEGTRATQAQIYDLAGKLLQTQPVVDGTVDIDLSSLPTGTYILNLTNDHSFKIIRK